MIEFITNNITSIVLGTLGAVFVYWMVWTSDHINDDDETD